LKTRKRSLLCRGVGRKICKGANEKKIPENSKKDRQIALLSLFQGGGRGQQKKDQKIVKK